METKKLKKIFCNMCNRTTQHELLYTYNQEGSEPICDSYSYDSDFVQWWNTINLFECCGCREITLREQYKFSEWNPGDVRITYHPPRIKRMIPCWKEKLPEKIEEILDEVYLAFQADCLRLVIMGCRALIDMIIVETIGDIGNFKQKLDNMVENGILSSSNKEILSAALEVGHATIHRGYKPEPRVVLTVLDIVENLLQSTVIKVEQEKLLKKTPKRNLVRKK